jgi:hypothetical protein
MSELIALLWHNGQNMVLVTVLDVTVGSSWALRFMVGIGY